MNCALAIGSSYSLLKNYVDPIFEPQYGAIPYKGSPSPSHLALSEFDSSIKIFTNDHAADCSFILCELKPPGCSGTYSISGRAAMDSNTFALSIT
jgi:hypothetical protein